MIGRKNCGGQPYNIVNHRYDDNLDGQRLKYHDDMVKFRGEVQLRRRVRVRMFE